STATSVDARVSPTHPFTTLSQVMPVAAPPEPSGPANRSAASVAASPAKGSATPASISTEPVNPVEPFQLISVQTHAFPAQPEAQLTDQAGQPFTAPIIPNDSISV